MIFLNRNKGWIHSRRASVSYTHLDVYKRQTLSEMYQERAANTKLEAVVMKECVPAVALMSKHHPLAHQESVTMKEIYAYPLVLFEDYQDPEQHRLLKLQPRQQILYLFDRGSLLDVVQTSNSISILKKNTYVDSAQYGIAELPIRCLLYTSMRSAEIHFRSCRCTCRAFAVPSSTVNPRTCLLYTSRCV